MTNEVLAELRSLRRLAEERGRQSHFRAIGGHFTRFVIVLAASGLAPDSGAGALRLLAGAAGLLFVIMAFWHWFVLMPSYEQEPMPLRPEPPPAP